MIPLRDHNPTKRPAVVTLVILAMNIAVFVLFQPRGATNALISTASQNAEFAKANPEAEFLYRQATVPCEVTTNEPLDQTEILGALSDRGTCRRSSTETDSVFPRKRPIVSLFTSMFLHGGWLHLLGNMLFLWIFGNNIEDRFRRVPYTVFYLAAGIVATLAHVFSEPNSLVPVVGASGAIAGVMGAYLVLFPGVRVTSVFAFLPFVPFRVRAWILLAVWFVSQFWVNPNDGVAWIAHVGGFVFGVVITLLVRSKVGVPSSPESVANQRR
jgi:membrane associated rhomboid family serine protease